MPLAWAGARDPLRSRAPRHGVAAALVAALTVPYDFIGDPGGAGAAAIALFAMLGDELPGLGPLASLIPTGADDGTDVAVVFSAAGIGYLDSFIGGSVVLTGLFADLDLWDMAPDPVIASPTATPTLTFETMSAVPEPSTVGERLLARLNRIDKRRPPLAYGRGSY